MNTIYWRMQGGANLHAGLNLLSGAHLHPGVNCAHEHGFSEAYQTTQNLSPLHFKTPFLESTQ